MLLAAAIGLLALIPAYRLSLWLDEILQLLTTNPDKASIRSIMRAVTGNAGGVPLGYLTQWAVLRTLGYSVLAARLPSVISSLLSCFGVGVLAVQAGVRNWAVAVILFALLPLEARYAVEARPYEQALCFTIWFTVLFVRLVRKPTAGVAACYSAAIALAMYTQPFALFVALAQLAFVLIRGRGRALWLAGAALTAAAAAFAPWFFYARHHWRRAIDVVIAGTAQLNSKTLLVIFHEITGAGYAGAAGVAILTLFALRKCNRDGGWRLLFLLCAGVPVVLVLAADRESGYFFAIRQLVFVLPFIALLAALGLEELMALNLAAGSVAAVALFAGLVFADLSYFDRPRENWKRAGEAILAQIQTGDACYAAIPANTESLFEFVEPSLKSHRCSGGESEVVVGMSPYSFGGEAKAEADRLYAKGLRPVKTLVRATPQVVVWKHQPDN